MVRNTKKSPLNLAAGKFVDHLGAAAVKKLKEKLGLNTELHKFYDNLSLAPTTTLTVWLPPPVIPQGTTNPTRVGDSCRVVSNKHRIVLSNLSTTACTVFFRMIATYRHEGYYGTPIDVNDILQTTTAISSFHSPNITGNDIRVLYDKTVGLESSLTGVARKFIDVNFDLHEQHLEWQVSDTTGANSALNAGAIEWLFMYGAIGTVTGAPGILVQREVDFVDN